MSAEELLRNLEKTSQNGHYFNIPRETGMLLHLLVKAKKATNILEIGTSNGYSTIWLASAAPNSRLTTIEIDEVKIREAKSNFMKAGLKNIEVIHADAKDATKKLIGFYDFVFLDAVKSEYETYLKNIMNNLEKGAVITADNIHSHKDKVQGFLDFLKNDKRFETITLDIGTGVQFGVFRG